jgi:hypothetical protein
MDKHEIQRLPAGREIDILVSEIVFNEPRIINCNYCSWEVDRFNSSQCEICYADNPRIPHYSYDICDAWEVVEKIGGIHLMQLKSFTPPLWRAAFGESIAQADTAPLVICRAALLAIFEKQDTKQFDHKSRGWKTLNDMLHS